jgi:hypothetical protein
MSVLGDVSDKGYPRNLQGCAKGARGWRKRVMNMGEFTKVYIFDFCFPAEGKIQASLLR